MRRIALFTGCLTVFACGGPDEGFDDHGLETDTSESAIAVGTNDISTPTRNAVVLVNGCTGTLVGPNLVLTAGICGFDNPSWATGNWHNLPSDVAVYFGPNRSAPIHVAYAYQVSTPPLAAPPWPDDIALLRLRTNVPSSVAVPRPVLVDRPAGLNTLTVIRQVGYGGGRNRRHMTGRNYRDWLTKPSLMVNAFEYTADANGPGIGDRGTNIEAGDAGGPMLLDGIEGPVMGELSHWAPYGIATFGPGGSGRSNVRGWLIGKLPQQLPDLSISAISGAGCTGPAGRPVISVTVRNNGTTRVPAFWLDVFPEVPSAPSVGQFSPIYRQITDLAPLESRVVFFSLGHEHENRTIGVGAVVDTTRTVAETNEANNTGWASLALPDCYWN